jgi:hypothetical protein
MSLDLVWGETVMEDLGRLTIPRSLPVKSRSGKFTGDFRPSHAPLGNCWISVRRARCPVAEMTDHKLAKADSGDNSPYPQQQPSTGGLPIALNLTPMRTGPLVNLLSTGLSKGRERRETALPAGTPIKRSCDVLIALLLDIQIRLSRSVCCRSPSIESLSPVGSSAMQIRA